MERYRSDVSGVSEGEVQAVPLSLVVSFSLDFA